MEYPGEGRASTQQVGHFLHEHNMFVRLTSLVQVGLGIILCKGLLKICPIEYKLTTFVLPKDWGAPVCAYASLFMP